MRLIAILLVLLGITAPIAAADIDPPCITTTLDASQRLLLIPDNNGTDPSLFGTFTVTVKNMDCVPIHNAVVEVMIGGMGKTGLCGGAVTTKNTDSNGAVTFNIPGGGCYKGQDAIRIRANGVEVRIFSAVVSPDYAGWDNAGQLNKWSLSITAVDFAAFAQAMGNGGSTCHDYDNNGATGASDLSVFGQVWSGGTRHCDP